MFPEEAEHICSRVTTDALLRIVFRFSKEHVINPQKRGLDTTYLGVVLREAPTSPWADPLAAFILPACNLDNGDLYTFLRERIVVSNDPAENCMLWLLATFYVRRVVVEVGRTRVRWVHIAGLFTASLYLSMKFLMDTFAKENWEALFKNHIITRKDLVRMEKALFVLLRFNAGTYMSTGNRLNLFAEHSIWAELENCVKA